MHNKVQSFLLLLFSFVPPPRATITLISLFQGYVGFFLPPIGSFCMKRMSHLFILNLWCDFIRFSNFSVLTQNIATLQIFARPCLAKDQSECIFKIWVKIPSRVENFLERRLKNLVHSFILVCPQLICTAMQAMWIAWMWWGRSPDSSGFWHFLQFCNFYQLVCMILNNTINSLIIDITLLSAQLLFFQS